MISSEQHTRLKTLLNKIDSVNMIVVNLYFDKNILPIEVSLGLITPIPIYMYKLKKLILVIIKGFWLLCSTN